jgi:hypothetical protein
VPLIDIVCWVSSFAEEPVEACLPGVSGSWGLAALGGGAGLPLTWCMASVKRLFAGVPSVVGRVAIGAVGRVVAGVVVGEASRGAAENVGLMEGLAMALTPMAAGALYTL